MECNIFLIYEIPICPMVQTKMILPTNFSICQRHEGNGQKLKQGLQDNNRNVMFAKKNNKSK